tara:strand:- start:1194 stop:1397 length:204 start_codon:yes stop_codon:yes gene_type:complete
MITKFECKETKNTIEFQKEMDTVLLNIESYEGVSNYISVALSEQDLFNLIGQLLRIQSEIRKEVDNG